MQQRRDFNLVAARCNKSWLGASVSGRGVTLAIEAMVTSVKKREWNFREGNWRRRNKSIERGKEIALRTGLSIAC